MNNKKLINLNFIKKQFILAFLFLMIYLLSTAAHAQMVSQARPQNPLEPRYKQALDLEKEVLILYDQFDTYFYDVAESVYDDIKITYSNTRLVGIRSLSELQHTLNVNSREFAIIWMIDTNLKGFKLKNGEIFSWYDIADLIIQQRNTHHIIGVGNSDTLQSIMTKKGFPTNNLHVQPVVSGVIDIKIAFYYSLWTLSELFLEIKDINKYREYNMAGENMRNLALRFLEKEANDLFERNAQPKEPIGELNETDQLIRFEKLKEKFPSEITNRVKFNSVNSANRPPLVFKSNLDQLGIGDIILANIPIASGLQGPIGFILDGLFDLLLKNGDSDIVISEDTVQLIIDAFKVVTSLVGGEGIDSGAVSSALKSLLDVLSKEFPFGEQLLPYAKLILDGLFALKGDATTITNFITSVLKLVIPDSLSTVRDLILGILDITPSLINDIQNGEEIITSLMKAFTGNLFKTFASKLLNETLHVDLAKVTQYTNALESVIGTIIQLMGKDIDIADLLSQNLENMINIGLNLLSPYIGNSEEVVRKLSTILMFAMSIVRQGQDKLIDRTKAMLNELIPNSTIDKVSKVETTVNSLIDKIGEIREKGIDSVSTIQSDVNSIIDGISGISVELKNLLKQVGIWVFGVLADKIPDSARSALPGISDIITVFLNYIDTITTPASVKIDVTRLSIEEKSSMDIPSAILPQDIKDGLGQIIKYVTGIFAFLADPTDKIKQFFAKTVNDFKNTFEKDPVGAIVDVVKLVFKDNTTIIGSSVDKLETYARLALSIFKIIKSGSYDSFQGVMQVIIAVVGTGIFKNFGVDLEPYLEVINNLFPDIMGIANAPSPVEATQHIHNLVVAISPTLATWVDEILGIVFTVREIFTNGLKWIFGQIVEWLGRKVEELVNQLLDTLTSALGGSEALPTVQAAGNVINPNVSSSRYKSVTNYGDRNSLTAGFGEPLIDLTLDAGLGGFSLFSLYIGIGLKPNFAFDTAGFKDFISDIVFNGAKLFGDGDFGDFLAKIFSFMEISPLLTAKIELGGFGSEKNSFMNFLLLNLGLKLDFSGSGYFAMNLLTFKGGEFRFEDFLKIIEWGFTFTITLSKTLTLLDFLTAGVGGGALSAAAEYLGLGGITVTITFALTVEIFKRAASDSGPEEATFTLKISIGVMIKLGFDLAIVAIELWGSVEIVLTFFQDLANDSPLQIYLEIIFRFGVTLTFLFWDFDASWEFKKGWDLSPSSPQDMKDNGGKGFDTDKDGLGDDYESTVPGLDPNSSDTDKDQLSDKYESQISGTDPTKKDTDGDGLDDFIEVKNTHTNPLIMDTDYDGLSDYQEATLYNTNPLQRDTDGDGLDDNFEVNHAWNVSWPLTPSVFNVIIGGKSYNDHTDPLDPDTDGDGLLDGQEGERGPWYGNPALAPDYVKNTPYDIIFGGGFTHPLDNDTDDDSYEQLVNGTISYRHLFMRDMSDGVEVNGQDVIFMVDGEPELRHVRTNPVRPDSDGDTGYTGTMNPGPINRFLNSDGYELSLHPPSDPLDGDTDDDGLIDGLEGTLAYDSNRTNYNNPDTDGDGLGDMQEILMHTDPMDVDTDHDMVPDGKEYLVFGTSPFLNDTDFDGLTDGQELFWFHTSPFLADSDGDGLGDASEIFDYYSNPMSDDTDRDGVNDYDEVKIFHTFVAVADTDNDGLLDGEELYTYKTSPFMWDTDNDSIYYPDPTTSSGISMKWGDFDEVQFNQSDPTIPDSDHDGIGDGWEVYLGTGHIPFMNPIVLDLKNNDTDGDGLLDGQELIIANTTNLIYPFISYHLVTPFNTSPVLQDTDGDGLNDSAEINIYMTFPNIVDTDNDTLTDYEEIMFHKTSPLKADTDGDGINDNLERTKATTSGGLPSSSKYNTSAVGFQQSDALNPDTDGDMLPDGAEVNKYNSSPILKDQFNGSTFGSSDGILDGLNLDSDFDGLPDGYEYTANKTDPKIYGPNQMISNVTSTYPFEGTNGTVGVTNPFNPDSDSDSLPDGLEVFNYGLNPTMNDTDLDGLSDGLELRIGTDPKNYTSYDEFKDKMVNYTLVFVGSPVPASYIGSNVPILVNAPSNAIRVSYRIFNGDTLKWSPEYLLQWDAGKQVWTIPLSYKYFDPGAYYFKASAYLDDGSILTDGLSFSVKREYTDLEGLLNSTDEILGLSINNLAIIMLGTISGFAITLVILNKKLLTQSLGKIAKRILSKKEDLGE